MLLLKHCNIKTLYIHALVHMCGCLSNVCVCTHIYNTNKNSYLQAVQRHTHTVCIPACMYMDMYIFINTHIHKWVCVYKYIYIIFIYAYSVYRDVVCIEIATVYQDIRQQCSVLSPAPIFNVLQTITPWPSLTHEETKDS